MLKMTTKHQQPRDRQRGSIFRPWRYVLIVVALALPQAAWPQEVGRCARVETPWPVVLPDGSLHEPSSLNLCLKLKLNPVTGIHDIRVNGISGGMVRSRIGESEGRSGHDPYVVFQRVDGDAYALVGYAWPEGASMRTFSLYDLAGAGQADAHTARRGFDSALAEEGFVLLVARRPD